MDISVYDPDSGAILYWSTLSQREFLGEEGVYLEGHIPSEFCYILNGEVTERPASPVSRTDLTLLDVPTGSKLRINGESYDAAGTVELEFPLSGTYSLRVECFPFLDWTDVVTV